MDIVGWFFILIAIFNQVNGEIKIVDLKVPTMLENMSNDEVVLDCDYELEKADEEGLVVKWFFGDDREMVYQWVPGRKPQALGIFKGRIDIDDPITDDPIKMYRALQIRNVTLDLTGYYHCQVSSFLSEDSEKKYMTVYEPADDFDLDHDPEQNMVNCTASGIFPKPKMNIYILNTNGTDIDDDDDDDDDNDGNDDDNDDDDKDDLKINEEEDNDHNNNGIDDILEDPNASSEDEDFIEENDDDTFNVTSILTYDEDALKPVTVFVCEMWIPQSAYKLKKKLIYRKGGTPSSVETQIESDNDNESPTDTTEKDVDDSSSAAQVSKILLISMLSYLFALVF